MNSAKYAFTTIACSEYVQKEFLDFGINVSRLLIAAFILFSVPLFSHFLCRILIVFPRQSSPFTIADGDIKEIKIEKNESF